MATDQTESELIYELKDGIGRATFNRPQARNALTFGMYERLAEICATVPGDGSLKAIIIAGAGGKAFAAGTDISLFRDFAPPGPDAGADGLAYEARMESVLARVEACPVPTIAAISGVCTGGGAVIAAICDVRIATSNLKFGLPIARTLGNCLSAQNLSRICAAVGMNRTRDLIFTSRLMGAEEALSAGLITQVLADHDELLARANELASQISQQAPLTMRATKVMLNALRNGYQPGNADQPLGDNLDNELVALCYGSSDFREGLEAFLAKRPPRWTGS